MRILLVATNRMRTPFPVYPIGVDYVATALGGRHDLRVLDLAAETADTALADACRGFQPEVVGLSIRNVDSVETSNPEGFIPDLVRLAAEIRRSCDALLLLGGPGFSIFPSTLMATLRADYGLIGEGERLPQLLDALARGDVAAAASVPGACIKQRAAKAPAPWPGPHVRAVASPANVDHYLRWGGMLNVQTKRGCPFLCTYCTYPAIEGRALRRFAPEAVAREWEALVAAGAKFLFVTDAVFNSHTRHNLDVADALVRRRISIPWDAFFLPMRPPADYYRRLRAAGLTHAEFGTESFSDAMLRSYRKPFTVAHALAAHREARRAGLHVAHYILLGGPGETRETVAETLDMCDGIEDAALFFFCGVRIYPGTQLHRIAVRQGQVAPQDDLLAPRFYGPAGLPVEAIAEMVATRSRGRRHWVIGSGNEQMAAAMKRMYRRGRTGPLWDLLVPT
ncbi:MAG: radical SAM protein [Deltaproteobacteria bacterium]|nr:radical SAM protein [Deltaproteobacteria bacterium]